MRRAATRTVVEWSVAAGFAVVLAVVLVACGRGSSSRSSGAKSGHPGQDFVAQPVDFRNLHEMTKVRGFYVDNRLGHLREALRVANSPKGGQYPVGTIIQLVPQEAMVKRRRGFDPATHDWEFFFLSVSPGGTTVETRGTTNVVNRFGGNCSSCHSAADPKWDMVCEHNHGCAPLPIGDDVIHQIQEADPRPATR